MRHLLACLPVLLLAACATAEEDPGFETLGDTGTVAKDSGATKTDSFVSPEDSKVSTPDTTVEDTFAADTFVADTFVADTFVADTFKPDTFVADTFVADTFVADTAPTDAAGCTGVIADWNWNTGTGPVAELVKSSATSQWTVGPANTYGPKDGKNYLATNPSGGAYVDTMREWVRLPTLPLGAYAGCKLKISVEVWRYAEGLSTRVDGGNLQYTTAADPATATDWKAVDGTSMAYDGPTTASSCGSTCFVYGQPLWAGRATPYERAGNFTSAGPMGAQLSLRFTFFSDGSLSSYAGLYVRFVRVEAVP